MIYDVLMQKRAELMKQGNPLAVEFTIRDINIISDYSQLRALKLKTPFPHDFKPSADVFECSDRIVHGDSIYRALEFCLLRNRVLEPHVTKVFQVFKRER